MVHLLSHSSVCSRTCSSLTLTYWVTDHRLIPKWQIKADKVLREEPQETNGLNKLKSLHTFCWRRNIRNMLKHQECCRQCYFMIMIFKPCIRLGQKKLNIGLSQSMAFPTDEILLRCESVLFWFPLTQPLSKALTMSVQISNRRRKWQIHTLRSWEQSQQDII